MLIKTLFKNYWILIVILIMAGTFRLWKLGSIPPSLTQDEAALGYNAYSILKTGRDEYGKLLPVIFKSFGDYKPGLYIYMDVPFVATMGFNEVSTRLPSALAGIISVWLIYLVCNKLFGRKTGILAAFVASLNPWLIYFSRGAWEANISLTLTLAGIYFFLLAREKNKYIIPSLILFALTFVTYQGAKLSTIIVLAVLIIIYLNEIIMFGKKYLFTGICLGILISVPIILSFFNGQSGRLDVFSIFSYPRPTSYTQTFLNEGGEKIGDLNYYVFHSEALNFSRGILGRYFNHFSAKFLIFEGDYQNPQHSAPYQGMLLLGDLILLVIGAFGLIKLGSKKETVFVWLWLILSPLPAVLSRDQVQSVRALNMSVPLIIILAIGLGVVINKIALLGKLKTVGYFFLSLVYLSAFIYFADAYYVHVPAHNSQYWNYGYKQVVEKISPIQRDYKNIFVEQSFAQPYIYFLYYQKYNPATYQKNAVLTQGPNTSDVGVITNLDNIHFSSIDWSAVRNMHGVLVAVDGITPIPADLVHAEIQKIYYLNGRDLAFDIIKIE